MDALRDERFAHIVKDPRFHKMPRQERKVKIDKRFAAMFDDKKFNVKYSVDKRGRPLNLTSNENLKRFYELSESDDDERDSSDDDGDSGDDDGYSGDDDSHFHENVLSISSKSTAKLTDNKDTGISRKKKETGAVSKKDKAHIDAVSKKDKAHIDTVSKKDKANLDAVSKKDKAHIDAVTKKDITDNIGAVGKKDKMCIINAVKKKKNKKEGDGLVVSEGPDLARGEGNEESSSEEENSEEIEKEEEEENQEEDIEHCWGEMDKDAPATSTISSRIAVCNMDWDRVKAVDIYVLLNSFKPPNGVIYSVKIYPSEFGLQRMKEEEQRGPIELVEDTQHTHNTEDAEGSSYHDEKLRQYQLNRLKYYYAVVECDSPNTANTIYEECDGMEYECSSTRLDLRFIPQNMTFDQVPKSECKEMPDSGTYKPSQFFTTALAQSKVDLTWDETDRERVNLMMQKFSGIKDFKEDDFQAYLASSSDDDDQSDYKQPEVEDDEESDGEEGEEKTIQKYKSLLHEIQEREEKKTSKHGSAELEITWEPGLKSATEEIIKKKQQTKDTTPWQEYLQKNKEKKKAKQEEKLLKKKEKRLWSNKDVEKQQGMDHVQAFSDDELPDDVDLNDPFFSRSTTDNIEGKKKKRKKKTVTDTVEPNEKEKKEKVELSLLLMDDDVDRHHFKLENLVQEKETNKKRKKKRVGDKVKISKEADFQVNLKDERFSAIYNSHLFNIDPSAPEFKRTKGMEALIEEKLNRSKKNEKTKQITGSKRKASSSVDMMEPVTRRKISQDNVDEEQSLSTLVKSVKAKTQKFYKRK